MKAVTFSRHGGLDVLEYTEDYSTPQPKTGEVLVKVKISSLNQVDLVVRQGYPGLEISLPHIPGGDIVGVIEEVGDEVDTSLIGKRVAAYPIVSCGGCPLCREGKENLCLNWKFFGLHLKGSYAEYVAIPARNAIELPDTISDEAALSVPVAGLTAFHGLKTVGDLKSGQTFLIWGGSGGLGTMAIQLAKLLGATVIATGGSDEKLKLMRSLGADHVFNRYTEEDISYRVAEIAPAGVDLVMNYVGPDLFDASFNMLKKGGTMLLCGIISGRNSNVSLHMTYLRHLSLKGFYLGTKDEMKELIQWIADGRIKPHIGVRFPLKEAAVAQEMMINYGHTGKILLDI